LYLENISKDIYGFINRRKYSQNFSPENFNILSKILKTYDTYDEKAKTILFDIAVNKNQTKFQIVQYVLNLG
jgi:hypothetical protein